MLESLQIQVISFGYKFQSPPVSHLSFDVRFLKNPYWDELLRPYTGLDKKIQDYVLTQQTAIDFLSILHPFLMAFIQRFYSKTETGFKIAFGCTGGQHRSVAIAEVVAKTLQDAFPSATVTTTHSELAPGKSNL